MCFDIPKNQKLAKIAETDLPCLKVLENNGDKLVSPAFISKYMTWKANKTNYEKKLIRIRDREVIEEGLHSTKSWIDARGWLIRGYSRRKIFPAIIPKGSLYWENRTEYVSEALKIISDKPFEKRADALKYLGKIKK